MSDDCVACIVREASDAPPREAVDNWCSDASFIQKSLKQSISTRNKFTVASLVENRPYHPATTEKRRYETCPSPGIRSSTAGPFLREKS